MKMSELKSMLEDARNEKKTDRRKMKKLWKVPKTTLLVWLSLKVARKLVWLERKTKRRLRIARAAGRDAVKRMRRASKLEEGYVGLLSMAWFLSVIRRQR